MKKLQNNFTTPEQSKRLLELGMPAWTADCYYQESGKIEIKNTALDGLYPSCWSVGRLIEIMNICNHPDDVDQVFCELAYPRKNLVEIIVKFMEENKGRTDFSKLEE